MRSSSSFVQGLLFLLAVLAVDDLLFDSEQLTIKQVNSMARSALVVVQVLRSLPNLTDMVSPTDIGNTGYKPASVIMYRFSQV